MTDQLVQFAQQLVIVLGYTVEYAYGIMVRQKQLEGEVTLLQLAFTVAATYFITRQSAWVASTKICPDPGEYVPPPSGKNDYDSNYARERASDRHREAVANHHQAMFIGYVLGGVLGAFVTASVSVIIGTAILQMINPQYYAILQLLTALKH